jgi:hypothetical protein
LVVPELGPLLRLDTLPEWPWEILDDTAPRTLGWHAIAWAEAGDWTGFPDIPEGWEGLRQPNGPRARQPFRYTARQKTFLLWFYALDDDAQWIYDSGIRRLAKGSGKSPFAAAGALTELLAPVRLEHFKRGAPGGVVGRPVDMPLVQIVATAETQTANTMRMVRAFAPKRSHIAEFYSLDPGKTIIYGLPEKTLEVITSSVTASEGAESTFVVKDELEHWRPSNNGPELSNTIEDNLAKSGARSLGTCNAWKPDQETVAEAEWDAWVAQEEGRTQGETRTLYDAVMAPPKVDMGNPAELERVLQDIYADCVWKRPHELDPDHLGEKPPRTRPVPGSKPDVRPIMRRIWHVASLPDDSRRKYLNRPTAPQKTWVDPEWWEAMANPDRVVAEGERVVMFFDGSRSRDATALIGCCVSDGHVFVIGIWEPGPAHDTVSVVPVWEVDAAVARAFRTWDVVGFFGDVVEWESFVKVEWPALYADELKVMAVPGGSDPQSIAWDMRGRGYLFTVAAELCRAEIEEGLFTHDGNPVLARHIANARDRENRYGTSIGKESKDSPLKIDGAVCTVGVRMVRQLVLAALANEPAPKSNELRRR